MLHLPTIATVDAQVAWRSVSTTLAPPARFMHVLANDPSGDLLLISQADEEDGMDEVGMPWLLKERPDLKCDYAIDEGGGMRLELVDGRVVRDERRRAPG